MNDEQIQQALLKELGLRVEKEMAAYVLRQLQRGTPRIPVMGGIARTGAPLRQIVDSSLFGAHGEASRP